MNKTTLESLEEALERLEQIDGMYSWAHLLYEVREALAEQEKQEPVYAFRRRGLDDFCTCTKERYDELVDKPNLFEVTTFYAEPVDAKAIQAEALEEAAKWLKESGLIGSNDCAAAIRGLK